MRVTKSDKPLRNQERGGKRRPGEVFRCKILCIFAVSVIIMKFPLDALSLCIIWSFSLLILGQLIKKLPKQEEKDLKMRFLLDTIGVADFFKILFIIQT